MNIQNQKIKSETKMRAFCRVECIWSDLVKESVKTQKSY